MEGTGKITAVVIAATIAAVLFLPFASIVTDGTETQSVSNEEFDAEPGTYQDLEKYNIVDGSETVEVDDGTGAVSLSDSEYQLNNTDGTINIDSGSANEGDTVIVSYDWQQTTGATSTIVDLLPLFVALLILVTIAAEIMNKM